MVVYYIIFFLQVIIWLIWKNGCFLLDNAGLRGLAFSLTALTSASHNKSNHPVRLRLPPLRGGGRLVHMFNGLKKSINSE